MPPLGVVGAGTMGAGIAGLAAEAGLATLLYDPDPEALARAPEGVEPVRTSTEPSARTTVSASTHGRVLPYLNVAAPAALVAMVPPTNAPS